ncbi:MAG: class I SAM-dependent methyltransferase [Acidimicrobiales bacterium]
MIDPGAANYQHAAGAYQRGRPSYPASALRLLADELDIVPGRRVVDVGAGTGKLTELLVSTGAEVTAVEPVAAMRGELASALPDVDLRDGTAEALPLEDQSVDVVVVAQAFHWFDHVAARQEFGRVLGPKGGLGLVSNDYDLAVPWVAAFAEVYRSRAPAGRPQLSDQLWRRAFQDLRGWTPLREARIPNPQRSTRTGLIERALSSSWVAGLDTEEQVEIARDVDAVLDDYADTRARAELDLPYITEIHWCHRA